MQYVSKRWGTEKIVVNNDLYCLKEMFLFKDHYCSAHTHPKDETFYIKEGKMLLITGHKDAFQKVNGLGTFASVQYVASMTGDKSVQLIPYELMGVNDEVYFPTVTFTLNEINAYVLEPEDTLFIPRGLYHMFYGLKETKFIEVSTPDSGENTRLTESY